MQRVTRSRSSTSSVVSASQDVNNPRRPGPNPSAPGARKTRITSPSDASESPTEAESDPEPAPKKRRLNGAAATQGKARKKDNSAVSSKLFNPSEPESGTSPPCLPPARQHALHYHRPLLLHLEQGRAGRRAFLSWFDSVADSRAMPWRKPWVDPQTFSDKDELRSVLERRAYEVWISEIMLQQTRVAAVIEYWNRWMAKWPVIQDLAAATPEEVSAAWKGLGYYSRATRIHEAAKLVVKDASMSGLLPADVSDLEAKIPGVGRYTAGAISAIVFGHAAPMVDGNVLRVLSRQLGLYGNVKTDKTVIDVLWGAAEALVKAVAEDKDDDDEKESSNDKEDSTRSPGEPDVSDRPGRWGQALMELGATICTPKPNCSTCPIRSSCRAYGEGRALAIKKGLLRRDENLGPEANKAEVMDIEDTCTLCESFEANEDQDESAAAVATPTVKQTRPKTSRNGKISDFFGTKDPAKSRKRTSAESPSQSELTPQALEVIVNHARRFPLKIAKKAVREEETLVCAIKDITTGQYLIQRRPEKGLLAGLWEFPSLILRGDGADSLKTRKAGALSFVSALVSQGKNRGKLTHVGELDSIPWLFSHLKLTMHVHLFLLDMSGSEGLQNTLTSSEPSNVRRWATADDVDRESMGTGMVKCWRMVKDSQQSLYS